MKSVWVDFNARVDGYCVVPARRFPEGAAVDEEVSVYDPEDNETQGRARVAGFDLDRGRVLLDVDWESFDEEADVVMLAQVFLLARLGVPSRMAFAAAGAVIFVTGLGAHAIEAKPKRPDAVVRHLEFDRMVTA